MHNSINRRHAALCVTVQVRNSVLVFFFFMLCLCVILGNYKKMPALSRYLEITLCNTLQNEYICKLLCKRRAKHVLPSKHFGSVGDFSDLHSEIPGSNLGGHTDYREILRSFPQSL